MNDAGADCSVAVRNGARYSSSSAFWLTVSLLLPFGYCSWAYAATCLTSAITPWLCSPATSAAVTGPARKGALAGPLLPDQPRAPRRWGVLPGGESGPPAVPVTHPGRAGRHIQRLDAQI